MVSGKQSNNDGVCVCVCRGIKFNGCLETTKPGLRPFFSHFIFKVNYYLFNIIYYLFQHKSIYYLLCGQHMLDNNWTGMDELQWLPLVQIEIKKRWLQKMAGINGI